MESFTAVETFNPTTMKTFNPTTMKTFNQSTMKTFNPTTMRTFNPTTMTAPAETSMMYQTTLRDSLTHPSTRTTGTTQSSPLVEGLDEAWKIAVYALTGA